MQAWNRHRNPLQPMFWGRKIRPLQDKRDYITGTVYPLSNRCRPAKLSKLFNCWKCVCSDWMDGRSHLERCVSNFRLGRGYAFDSFHAILARLNGASEALLLGNFLISFYKVIIWKDGLFYSQIINCRKNV